MVPIGLAGRVCPVRAAGARSSRSATISGRSTAGERLGSPLSRDSNSSSQSVSLAARPSIIRRCSSTAAPVAEVIMARRRPTRAATAGSREGGQPSVSASSRPRVCRRDGLATLSVSAATAARRRSSHRLTANATRATSCLYGAADPSSTHCDDTRSIAYRVFTGRDPRVASTRASTRSTRSDWRGRSLRVKTPPT